MKLKLDENLPDELVELLAAHNHEVQTVPQEHLTGQPDPQIFQAAVAEERMLLTQDLDFSDIRKFKPGSHPGVVLIRLRHPSRLRLIQRLRQVLAVSLLDDWANCFVVISDRKLRIRRP